jgi:hypothetical protein
MSMAKNGNATGDRSAGGPPACSSWTLGLEILLLGILFTSSGCLHTRHDNAAARGGAETLLPKFTSVTTWPLAVILTNGSAFESEFTLTLADDSPSPLNLSGQLLVRGGKLRFEAARFNGKAMRAGDFGVIWDASARQGFAFSEALQGYAPISEALHCTNLLTQVTPGETERIDGHPADKRNATIMGSNGQTLILQMLTARDLGNLPLKIFPSADSPYSFALTLSKIQLLVPADELFLPPDGFTKYVSAAAMLDELTDRQQDVSGVKRAPGGSGRIGDYDQSGSDRHSRGYQSP